MKQRRALILSVFVVVLLVGGCGLWVWQAKRQFALNRALIAALTHNDTKQALALVQAGADPNTRYNPPPAPSLKRLLNQLRHHSPVPANTSPTAFQLACGMSGRTIMDTPYFVEAVKEDLPLLEAMRMRGANVNARALNNCVALHSSLAWRRLATVEWLLQHDADVNAQDKWGHTTLMYASRSATRLLLSHGANPNLQDQHGNASLHYFLSAPHAEGVISDLLAHGADPNLRNKAGKTPLMMAQELHHSDVVALLRKGAK